VVQKLLHGDVVTTAVPQRGPVGQQKVAFCPLTWGAEDIACVHVIGDVIDSAHGTKVVENPDMEQRSPDFYLLVNVRTCCVDMLLLLPLLVTTAVIKLGEKH